MAKISKIIGMSLTGLVLSGCSLNVDSLKGLFKKAGKQVLDKIIVSDEKMESLRNDTKNIYLTDFELTSQSPYIESETEVLDIASLSQEQYVASFKTAMGVYELNNGESNINQRGYFSKVDEYLQFLKDGSMHTIQKNGDSYIATKDGIDVDVNNPDEKTECDRAYDLWKNQMEYCFSFELNSLINIKARLEGSTADDNSTIDFLSKVVFKEYFDAGNYIATYVGEAHKNDGANDVNIDYIELKYVDYLLQYSLVHTVTINYDSLIESHKLTYSKVLYNVALENCF